jgi:hypothetical protein
MKNYLSFGGGVNSVAMCLLLEDQGVDFKAIFVNHGTDHPETYEYLEYFTGKGHPVTEIKPDVEGFDTLIEYYLHKRKMPSIMKRDCSDKFKARQVYKYIQKPCFMMIGFDAGEAHRARISGKKGVENRFPLIEENIDRAGCIKLIRKHGLMVPRKSGCFCCFYQKGPEWQDLRRERPELFCKAARMEQQVIEDRKEQGKSVFTLNNTGFTVREMVNERQKNLPGLEELDFPPCECGL